MTIEEEALLECTQLRLAILQNGLKMIGNLALACCRSVESIKISPSVTAILDDAFEHCSNLTRVVFCDMIKSLYLRR
jgi:hypothetical protein